MIEFGQDGDTVPDGVLTPSVIEIDTVITEMLEFVGDSDWFRFTAREDHRYWIVVHGVEDAEGTPGVADPTLRIHDGDGILVGEVDDIEDGISRDAWAVFEPVQSGTYFIEIVSNIAENNNVDQEFIGSYEVGLYDLGVGV
jgi:hypothetical protein